MNPGRATAAKVGIFTFAAGTLLAVVLIVFGGLRFWKHKDRYYLDVHDSAMGIDDGTQVYFDGIAVGSVGSIEIAPDDPSMVEIVIDVDRGTPVRVDTTARLELAGITGLKVVDLHGGSGGAPPLPPGSHIRAGQSGFDKLQKQAEILADQTAQMVTRAREILDRANKIVEGIATLTDRDALGAIITSTRTTTANLAKASSQIAAMVDEHRTALRGVYASVGTTTDSANGLLTDLRNLVRGNQSQIAAAVADLRQGARTFKDLAREVREKPSRLMFSDPAPERKLP